MLVSSGRGVLIVAYSTPGAQEGSHEDTESLRFEYPLRSMRVLFLLLWLVVPTALGETISGRVVAVADGDTLTIADARKGSTGSGLRR